MSEVTLVKDGKGSSYIISRKRCGITQCLYMCEYAKSRTKWFGFCKSRGRGARTPVNGFGDRRTTAVLFP